MVNPPMFPDYKCRECWDDPRGVPARVRDTAGISSWVACDACSPVTLEKATRMVAAHRRVRETERRLRPEALERERVGK